MQLTWMDFVSERQVAGVSSGDVLDLFALLLSVPGMQSDPPPTHTHNKVCCLLEQEKKRKEKQAVYKTRGTGLTGLAFLTTLN